MTWHRCEFLPGSVPTGVAVLPPSPYIYTPPCIYIHNAYIHTYIHASNIQGCVGILRGYKGVTERRANLLACWLRSANTVSRFRSLREYVYTYSNISWGLSSPRSFTLTTGRVASAYSHRLLWSRLGSAALPFLPVFTYPPSPSACHVNCLLECRNVKSFQQHPNYIHTHINRASELVGTYPFPVSDSRRTSQHSLDFSISFLISFIPFTLVSFHLSPCIYEYTPDRRR